MEEEAGEEGSGGRGRRRSSATEELVVREAVVPLVFPAGRGSQLLVTDAGREPHATGRHIFAASLPSLSFVEIGVLKMQIQHIAGDSLSQWNWHYLFL
jgi:hypothetical protein